MRLRANSAQATLESKDDSDIGGDFIAELEEICVKHNIRVWFENQDIVLGGDDDE